MVNSIYSSKMMSGVYVLFVGMGQGRLWVLSIRECNNWFL